MGEGPTLHDELLPCERDVFGWIEEIFARGVRRPGYPADRWAEGWIASRFRELGLERVRHEPVSLPRWEPRRWSLAMAGGAAPSAEIDCFPLPHAAPPRRSSPSWWRSIRRAGAGARRGRAARRAADAHPARRDRRAGDLAYDPRGTFADAVHVLPFGREFMAVMEPVDRRRRDWLRRRPQRLSGRLVRVLRALRRRGAADARRLGARQRRRAPARACWRAAGCSVRSRSTPCASRSTSYNVVGELPGADDETVDHRLAPRRAVGVGGRGRLRHRARPGAGRVLVASCRAPSGRTVSSSCSMPATWPAAPARAPSSRRIARSSTAWCSRCISSTPPTRLVERDGPLQPTGHPEARWWFTTRLARLEAAVRAAIEREGLTRSLDPAAGHLRAASDDRRRLLPPRRRAAGELPDCAVLPVRRHGHARQDPPPEPRAGHPAPQSASSSRRRACPPRMRGKSA